MDRRMSTSTLVVPTVWAEGEARHIISHRDGPTLCGEESTGEQSAPTAHQRHKLCQRCVQKYMRKVLEETSQN